MNFTSNNNFINDIINKYQDSILNYFGCIPEMIFNWINSKWDHIIFIYYMYGLMVIETGIFSWSLVKRGRGVVKIASLPLAGIYAVLLPWYLSTSGYLTCSLSSLFPSVGIH